MFTEIANFFLKIIKFGPRYIIILGLIAALWLFTNKIVLNFLGIGELTKTYYDAINYVCLGLCYIAVVVAILLVSKSIINFCRSNIGKAVSQHKIRKGILQSLKTLTEEEKQILRFYISNNVITAQFDFENGVLITLINKGLIDRNYELTCELLGPSYDINEFARETLKKDWHILGGRSGYTLGRKPQKIA